MKQIITIVFLFAFLTQIKSQTVTTQEAAFRKEMAERNKKTLLSGKDNASLIIEGTVIRCDEYYNKSKTAIYSQYTVRVKNLIKGTSKDSLVEIISYRDYGDEIMPLDMSGPPVKNLPKGYNAIFYGTANKLELNENTNSGLPNYFDVYNKLIIVIQQETSYNAPVAQYGYLTFNNKKELYDAMGFFVKGLQNEKVLEAKVPTKKELNDFITHANKALNQKAKALATAITFSFQNAITTGTNVQKYYEFDVSASSSTNEYLDFVQVDIDYAPAAFGNSVVATSNVTVTNVPAYPAVKYPNLFKFDNNTNILRIVLSADFSTPNRNLITTSVTALFHVKMKVNCNQNVNLSFVSGNTGGAYAPTATSPSFTNFSPVNDNDFDGTTACALNITNFSPTQINGGKNEILTINGVNFGATQGSGYVKLKNADDGGNTYLQLDADDYISWTNNQIKVRVSAHQRTTPVGAPVGSGFIMVSNGTNTVSSIGTLSVFYSQKNYLETAPPFPTGFSTRKERIYSTGNPPPVITQKKYPIKIDSASCAAFPGALACIKKAIKYWVCETKIPFIIVGDTTFPNSNPSNNTTQNVLDGVSTIRFSNFSLITPTTTAIGNTYFRARRCDTATAIKTIGTLPEFDIEFDLNQIWFCDTNVYASKPANTYDFYEVALHELGHANLLKHNNAFNSVMWYGSTFSPSVSFGARRIFLQIPDYVGGSQIITDSKNIAYAGNCSFLPVSQENCIPVIGIAENQINPNDIIVQPNPFNDNLLISITTKNRSAVKLSIIDVLGKTVKTFEDKPNVIGEYKIEYNGNELVSGVYFIKIEINNEFITKKIIKQ